MEKTVTSLKNLYNIRRSEKADFFLEVSLKWKFNRNEVVALQLSQKTYTTSILRRFEMDRFKEAVTPMVNNFLTGSDIDENSELLDVQHYQQIIGSQLYLALQSRPDILAPVLILARYMQKPTWYCYRVAKRLLRYLKGAAHLGLTYRSGGADLSAFVDSDFASDTKDRKSMTVFIVKVGDNLINWGAKKQTTVTLFTCKAKYFAVSFGAQKIVWMGKLMNEICLFLKTIRR